FRTMQKDTPKYANAPRKKDDKRITKVGKVLRKTSLDELPQLINVLRAEMSMVGPRPEMPHIVARYAPWQKKRLDVNPGITGLWQILGRKDLPLEKNLEYDFYYINNQSFFLDILIILKTIPAVLSGKGAY
ncbi:MAG: sugar transferase, partial [Patescibacteria group bacterium]